MTCLVTLESWQPRKATLGSSRADTVGPALTEATCSGGAMVVLAWAKTSWADGLRVEAA